jgi:hypothetical protein
MILRLHSDAHDLHEIIATADGVEERFRLRMGLSREVAEKIVNDMRLVRILESWSRDPNNRKLAGLLALAVKELEMTVACEHHDVLPLDALDPGERYVKCRRCSYVSQVFTTAQALKRTELANEDLTSYRLCGFCHADPTTWLPLLPNDVPRGSTVGACIIDDENDEGAPPCSQS